MRVQGSDVREHYRPAVTKFWLAPAAADICPTVKPVATGGGPATGGSTTAHDVTEMATRRKKFRNAAADARDGNVDDDGHDGNGDDDDAEVESMSLSGATRVATTAVVACWLVGVVSHALVGT